MLTDLGDSSVVDQGPGWDMSPLPDGYITDFRKMYAHSKTQLFAIDPATLKLSLVGTFGPGAPDINDLAVTPSGDLYAISINDLYKVDKKTAATTWITKVTGTANVALTFEHKGTLLASDKAGALRRIDPKTGQVTQIGTYGVDLGASGDLVAIQSGVLFGVNDVGAGKKDDNDLITIDPATGKGTIVGPIGYDRVWGLAYWKGTIYGLTKEGELLGIDPQTGKGTHINTFSTYEFWGAAVTPLAPLQ